MFLWLESNSQPLFFLMNYNIEKEESMPQDHPNTQKQDISRNVVSKFDTDDERSYNPTKGEAALWTAVITQALMDAGSASAKPEAQHEKAKAIRWLLGNSEDFTTVCQNAGKDPSYIRQKAKEAIARGCVWRRGMQEHRAEVHSTANTAPSSEKKYYVPVSPPHQHKPPQRMQASIIPMTRNRTYAAWQQSSSASVPIYRIH